MQLLDRDLILADLNSLAPESMFVEPLLDAMQVGATSLDLRLGYDFLVSVLTRKAYIGLQRSDDGYKDTASYFQQTRRDVGDRFVLYPGQIVLTTTLEYIALPSDVLADIVSRSSYTRLGIHLSTMVQPGFHGCVPIELFNHGNNAVELVVGSRLFQARFYRLDNPREYGTLGGRKYFGHVRPVVSQASIDGDLSILESIRARNAGD